MKITKRQLRVTNFLQKQSEKIGKLTGYKPEYDVGQLVGRVPNGAKYNLKDWETYMKKDLPTRTNIQNLINNK